MDIGQDQAHLWYVFTDRITDPGLLEDYRRLLSPDEAEGLKKIAFEGPRREYLVARALCRTVLSQYADIRPEAWSFTRNPYGRPEIAAAAPSGDGLSNRLGPARWDERDGPSQTAADGIPPLRFSLSHTPGLIACLITLGLDAAVDVEDMARRIDDASIADSYFSPAEAEALRSLPASRRPSRFVEYWTLKESYMKARGMGLSIPLDQFSLHLDETGAIRISFDPSLKDDAADWQFALFQPSDRHMMAAAIRRGPRPDVKIVLKQTVPLQQ